MRRELLDWWHKDSDVSAQAMEKALLWKLDHGVRWASVSQSIHMTDALGLQALYRLYLLDKLKQ